MAFIEQKRLWPLIYFCTGVYKTAALRQDGTTDNSSKASQYFGLLRQSITTKHSALCKAVSYSEGIKG